MKSKMILFVPLFLFALFFSFSNNVLAAGMDLSIDSVSFVPAQPIVDQTTKIVVKVKYTGSYSLTTDSGINNVAFSHSDFKQIVSSESGLSISPSSYSPLYSGSYFTYTIVGKFISDGAKELIFKIDGNNQLIESNENNNTFSKTINILSEGDLIKLSNNSAIYVIKNDGKKHLYVNGPTFWSYYSGTWNSLKLDNSPVYIKEISQNDFDSIDTGKNVAVKSGARLIKFQNSSKVYTVFRSAKLKLMSDQIASNIYGSKWKDKIITIQNSFESDYTQASQDFVDSDNDGIDNEDEINIYHTNPNKSDSDEDGYKDGSEVLDDYDPNVK